MQEGMVEYQCIPYLELWSCGLIGKGLLNKVVADRQRRHR